MTTDTERASSRRQTAAVEPQPPPRRSIFTRIKLGHLIAITAGLLAAVTTLAVLRSNQSTMQLVVATAPIASGTVIGDDAVTVEEVLVAPDFGQRFVTQDEMARVPGSVARREIAEGEPLLDTDLAAVAASDGLRAMSVPLDQGRAVGGGLRVGDRVDVIAVTEGVARFIATDVEVLQVPVSEAGTLSASTSWAPTLAVTDQQALQIASALDTADVHLVRSTGAPDVSVDEVTPPAPVGEGDPAEEVTDPLQETLP